LRPLYAAAGAAAAEAALDAFEAGEWGRTFPTVVAAWRRAWTQVIPFLAVPPELRRVIHTTNAVGSVHARVRKIIRTRGHFPTGDVPNKPIWLALRNVTAGWPAFRRCLARANETLTGARRRITAGRR
jgi:putative transposase